MTLNKVIKYMILLVILHLTLECGIYFATGNTYEIFGQLGFIIGRITGALIYYVWMPRTAFRIVRWAYRSIVSVDAPQPPALAIDNSGQC